ncbi:potassium transporter TrkH [Rhodobacteraceae bacterium WD3A24]|nr:potassium transporter TrkH [Rhodobacteraceae bacterium WD3A24]
MRRFLDLPLLVILAAVGALAMLAPALHALATGAIAVFEAFFYSALLFGLLTALLALGTARYEPRDIARSQFLSLVGAYVVLPPILAVPMVEAVEGARFLEAWFEMVSSFTTTGATLYETAQSVPDSVHLWRALVGWLGGFFTLLAVLAMLAPVNLGGFEVLSDRAAGRSGYGAAQITRVADPSERLVLHARQLAPIYAGLTGVLWLALTVAGDRPLPAVLHAMSTLATSGITMGAQPGAGAGLAGEALIFAGLIFAVTRRGLPGTLLPGETRGITRDPEIWIAATIVLGVGLALFLRHALGAAEGGAGGNAALVLRVFWGGVFTALSFLTTTGFVSAEWAAARAWSGLETPGLVLAALAVTGGGVATTAGGLKLLRVYALWRLTLRELDRLIHPSSVAGQGAQLRRIRRQGGYSAWIFAMLFIASNALIVMVLALAGLEFEPAIVFAMAAFTTTGPLVSIATEVQLHWSDLSDGVRAILAAAMVLGRLELLALIVVLLPESWRG